VTAGDPESEGRTPTGPTFRGARQP
jgi:hypothetical protein